MTDFAPMASSLTTALNLSRPPVAVSLVDRLPANVAMWTGSSPAGCRFWQEAMQRTLPTPPARDHDLCADVLTDDVAVFAIPGAKEAFAARIEALAQANRILTRFHSVRKQQVESGARPTAADTMAATPS